MSIEIKEMAEKLKDVRVYLTDGKLEELYKNIIKLAIFDSPLNNNHWKNEVHSALHTIPKLKETHKFPKKEFINTTITNHCSDRIIDVFMPLAISEEPNEHFKTKENVPDIVDICKKYIWWLSEQLSNKGYVETKDVHIKLKELGL